MDFFGILFDMKNGKKIPYSKNYFDTLFAENLAGVTALTGTLPLTFTTSETALRSWTIYGNNYEHKYSTSGTLPLTFTTQTAGNADDWSISGNDNIGKNLYDYENAELTDWYINASGEQAFGGGSYYRTQRVSVSPNTQYTISWQDAVQPGTTAPYIRTCYYSGNTFILRLIYSGITITGKTVTVTTPSNCDSILLQLDDKTSAQGQYFVNVMLNAGDTAAPYEPYQIGVGQRTKNLLEITATSQTINGVTFTVNKEAGTITANGTASAKTDFTFSTSSFVAGTYILSGISDGSSSTYYMSARVDGSYTVSNRLYDGEKSYTPSTQMTDFALTVANGATVSNLVFKPMLRLPDTSADFVPYGYEIPLTVNNTPQDIYIGDSPLTAGETISKASTGVDIATADGNNTITTTLYNQPDMSITYNEFTGVGILTANLFNKNACELVQIDAEGTMKFGTQLDVKGGEQYTLINTNPRNVDIYILVHSESLNRYQSTQIRTSPVHFIMPSGYKAYLRTDDDVLTDWDTIGVTDIALYEGNLTNPSFVPYGYKIPLTITSGQQSTDYDIFIGDAPLTDGQSVTDTLTLGTYEGENTIDTTLTDPVSMTIKYKE